MLQDDGDVLLVENFISPLLADASLAELSENTAWRRETLRLFGRAVLQPRCTAWIGDPSARYRYSGLTLHPQPWTRLLAELRGRVVEYCVATFDSVLLNRYRDGSDAIAPHSDDELELGPTPVIACISLGATRTLRFRHRHERDRAAIAVPLRHGSLLVMRGTTQRNYHHGIARTRAAVGERISLTFRRVAA